MDVQHGRLNSTFSSYILESLGAYLKISQKYRNLISYFEDLECCILRCDAVYLPGKSESSEEKTVIVFRFGLP